MAFNFNWSPLSGDPGFYKRAEELLTDAMNKNPKPPIIVDDILVSELNLGDVPPDLDIVEISDIGVDRFRGTFKMSYNGNAFITLKTRVQANPLNTYLMTRPVFASPMPLAAQSGLTIPIQITLADFRLSAIIILVFSRQKGLTIVFRNDPLESLKVSSTFDSIPFVANYLQKEIERQIRMLLMDQLPTIIHRLSLRLWVPEHSAEEHKDLTGEVVNEDEPAVDPLASPPQDPVDSTGAVLTPAEIASLSLDSSLETQSLFSRKNLLRLATLTDSHRTLSLFTPNIRDAVFRARTGPLERGDMPAFRSKVETPALSRKNSHTGSLSTTYTFDSHVAGRPSLHSFATSSSASGLTMGGLKHAKALRKRKKRVVNLRSQPENDEHDHGTEDGSTITDSTSMTESNSTTPSIFSAPPATSNSGPYRDMDLVTPPRSPQISRTSTGFAKQSYETSVAEASTTHKDPHTPPDTPIEAEVISKKPDRDRTIRARGNRRVVSLTDPDTTPKASMYLPDRKKSSQSTDETPPSHLSQYQSAESGPSNTSSSSSPPVPSFLSFITDPSNGGSIAEKAWMMKMAKEVARRYEDERTKGIFGTGPSGGDGSEDKRVAPPPAYAQ